MTVIFKKKVNSATKKMRRTLWRESSNTAMFAAGDEARGDAPPSRRTSPRMLTTSAGTLGSGCYPALVLNADCACAAQHVPAPMSLSMSTPLPHDHDHDHEHKREHEHEHDNNNVVGK